MPKTSRIGVRGLLNRAFEKNEDDRALKLAEAAANLRPKDSGVLDTLYTLQTRTFDWPGARKTLAAQRRHGYLPKPEASRRDAMLALAQAGDAEEETAAAQAADDSEADEKAEDDSSADRPQAEAERPHSAA